MLKTTFKISLAVALLTVGSMAGGHGKGNSQENLQEGNKKMAQEKEAKQENNNTSDVSALSDEDKAEIIYIVEEEKVARDVYRHLAESWDAEIFSKIADSEQKHVDAVTKLFSTYEIELPLTMDEEGIFTNEELQEMYNELIAKGEQSLKEALTVGVEIEETDIEDLEALLDSELDDNVEKVYSRILNGSYNHLRAFNRELDKQ